MPVFCIRKEKIDKLKGIIKNLSEKNQLDALVELSSEARIGHFKKIMSEDEAVLLNRELEKAVASDRLGALKTWVRSNLDIKYRERQITNKQKQSIKRFIESKLYPSKSRSQIIKIDDLLKMSDKKLDTVLRETFGEEKYLKIKEDLLSAQRVDAKNTVDALEMSRMRKEINAKKSEIKNSESEMNKLKYQANKSEERRLLAEINAKKREIAEMERKAYLASPEYAKKQADRTQRAVIERYLKDKKKKLTRSSVPINDILEMNDADQLKFLEGIMSKHDAKISQENIQSMKQSEIERKIDFLGKNFKSLDEVNNFIDSRVDKLAEQAAGIGLTDDEVAKFTELGNSFYEASKKIGNDIGNKDKEAENIEWGNSYKALEEYKESLIPRSLWQGVVQKLGRANMLASIKTPFLNIESNTVAGITEALNRRFANRQFTSSVDKEVVSAYRKFARKMFAETGIDFTRMVSIDDTVTGAGKIVGETSQNIGVGALDSYADFIFNKTLTIPDVAFGAAAFADSASLQASKAANGDRELAKDIFEESTKLTPSNIIRNGVEIDVKAIRDHAIADARLATYTNDSASSKLSLKLREALNIVPGLGDFTFPFVKTVANVAELTVDYAGVGFIKGTRPMFAVGKQMMKGEEIDRELLRAFMSNFARAGIGMTIGYLMAAMFDPDDFMGAYDPARIKIDQLSNANYNAVLINTPMGKRWVSTDYLGPIGAPFVAFMYAKKYGNVGGYINGAISHYLSQLPFSDAQGIFKTASDLSQAKESVFTGLLVDFKKKTGEFLSSRMTPGILYDLARASDEVQRDTKQSKFVVNTPLFEMNFDDFIAKIPYLRLDLPVKYDALGRVMYESSPIESMLFGARDRSARTDAITSEIYRLRDEGYTPNIKDIRFMNSDKVDELKAKTGDKFYDIARKYGEDLAVKIEKEMNRTTTIPSQGEKPIYAYQKLSDEEKQKRIGDIGQKLYEKMLISNGIKYR